jgi:hypothetical protein
MKTLLISGGAPLPDSLRETIVRGSTSVVERAAADIDPRAPLTGDVDRVVFWAPRGDDALRQLASRLARAERAARREVIVYITAEGQPAAEGVTPDETYAWPRDEDRLVMAFMTGA